MTAKKRCPPRRRRADLSDVIPDGAQRRAGIQTGAPQVPAPPARTTREARSLDPGFRLRRPRDDIKQAKRHAGRRVPLLTSSRTARSAEPGSRRALRKCPWIPTFAGMTAKKRCPPRRRRADLSDVIPDGAPLFSSSSRTARSAEPGSRQALRKYLRHASATGSPARTTRARG